MVRIIYFARLREVLGAGEERIMPPEGVGTVAALREWLAARGGIWRMELLDNPNLCVAVNHDYATGETALGSGDQVAFFPPVTGG
jgi:molybdopterin synthase sulfur carrier subunit